MTGPVPDAVLGLARWATRSARHAAGRSLTRLLDVLVPALVREVLDRVDLTSLVRERVDLAALAATLDLDALAMALDVDAVVARVDLDAVVARLDLVGLAREVVDGIDLPGLVRDSTGSVASETVQGVRLRGVAGDEAVGRAVDRLLRRPARTAHPEAPQPPR